MSAIIISLQNYSALNSGLPTFSSSRNLPGLHVNYSTVSLRSFISDSLNTQKYYYFGTSF